MPFAFDDVSGQVLAVPEAEAEVGRRENPVHPLQDLSSCLKRALSCGLNCARSPFQLHMPLYIGILSVLKMESPLRTAQMDLDEVVLVFKRSCSFGEAEGELGANLEGG